MIADLATGHLTPLRELLREPKDETAWLAAVVARIDAAGARPVLRSHGRPGALERRVTEAGWLRVDGSAPAGSASRAREASWPIGAQLAELGPEAGGAGSPRPTMLLVGDRLSTFTTPPGAWLFRALRLLGHDELTLRVIGITGKDGEPVEIGPLLDLLGGVPIVALGKQAAERLAEIGVEPVDAGHPRYWRGFKRSSGPEGYADHLEAAGVPEGPWRAHELPVGDRPTAKAPRPKGEPAPRTEALVEQAHRLFVSGEVKTLSEAADRAGVGVHTVRAAARENGWKAERTEHHRRITQEALQRSIEAEARALAEVRGLSWESLRLAIADVLQRLRAGQGDDAATEALRKRREGGDAKAIPLHPSPNEVRALVQATVALGSGGGSVEVPLEQLPVDELARRVLDAHRKIK